MRKTTLRTWLLIAIALMVVLAGCSSSKPANTGSSGGGGSSTSAGSSGSGSSENVKPIEWKLFTINNETYHTVKTYSWWAQEVEKRTNGKLKITIYPGGSLPYKQNEALTVLEQGLVDAAEVWGGALGGAVKALEAIDLPGFIPNDQALRLKLQDEIMGDLNAVLDKKNHNASIYSVLQLDARNIYATDKIDSFNALKGKKVRAQAALETNFTNLIGGVGTPLAFTEVYLAMQQKMVDGFWLIDSATFENKMYEVANYIIDLGIGGSSVYLMINDDSFNSLPADVQQVIKDLEEEYQEEAAKNFKHSQEVSRKALLDAGMEVVTWSDADMKRVYENAEEILNEWYGQADDDAKQVFDKLKKFVEENSK